MRRREKQITEKTAVESVIRQSLVCRLGLSDDAGPYVVPLCFGYEEGNLYFHAAGEGKKMDMIRNNDRVCFEFDIHTEIVEADKACGWGMKYQSVIGFGKVSFLDDVQDKLRALGIIMRQYSDRSFSFSEDAVRCTSVFKVTIDSMTGKESGY